MKRQFSFIVLLFVLLSLVYAPLCSAQVVADTVIDEVVTVTDTTALAKDTVIRSQPVSAAVNKDSLAFALRPHPFQPNPKKSGLYAAILPGLGQVYNRQYWKLPIVYAGLGTLSYFMVNNLTNYRKYRKAYIGRLSNPGYKDEFTNMNLGDNTAQLAYVKQYQDEYNKSLNMSVLLTGLGYFVQILDAITAAHLKNFDMSRDISMRVLPVATPFGVGVGLAMNFK